MESPLFDLSEPGGNSGSRWIIWLRGILALFFYFILYINFDIYIYYTCGFLLQCEWFTAVSVHHGVKAKTVGQTRTHTTCTCDRCSVTGGGYGVTQSHLQCDPCYTLMALISKRHLILCPTTQVTLHLQPMHLLPAPYFQIGQHHCPYLYASEPESYQSLPSFMPSSSTTWHLTSQLYRHDTDVTLESSPLIVPSQHRDTLPRTRLESGGLIRKNLKCEFRIIRYNNWKSEEIWSDLIRSELL